MQECAEREYAHTHKYYKIVANLVVIAENGSIFPQNKVCVRQMFPVFQESLENWSRKRVSKKGPLDWSHTHFVHFFFLAPL